MEILDASQDWWKCRLGARVGAVPSNYVVRDVAPRVTAPRAPRPPAPELARRARSRPAPPPYPHTQADKACAKLWRSIHELATSEFAYYIDLRKAFTVFVLPVRDRLGVHVKKELFNSWEEMLAVHETLYAKLTDAVCDAEMENGYAISGPLIEDASSAGVENIHIQRARKLHHAEAWFTARWGGEISEVRERVSRSNFLIERATAVRSVFVEMTPFLKTATQYIVRYPSALGVLETNRPLGRLLPSLEENRVLKNLKLRDYLIKPIQRICKYPLLFRELISNAPACVGGEDADLVNELLTTQDSLIEVATSVNSMLKKAQRESSESLAGVVSRIRPKEDASHLRGGDVRLVRCDESLCVESSTDWKLANAPLAKLTAALTSTCLTFLSEFQTRRGIFLRVVHVLDLSSRDANAVVASKSDREVFEISHTRCRCDGAALREAWVSDLTEVLSACASAKRRLRRVAEASAAKRRSLPSLMGAAKKKELTSAKRVDSMRVTGTPALADMISELEQIQSRRGLLKQ